MSSPAIHGVSRVTVRRALGELARERLIERRRSAGTRVIYRPLLAPMTADISGMLANLADMGRRTAVKLLSFDYVPAEGAVAQALGVAPDQMLQRSVRVRSVDGEPFSYLTTHVPGEHFADLYAGRNWPRGRCSICSSAPGSKSSMRASASAPDWRRPTSPRRSACACGTPLIELIRVVYDQSGRGVEHLHALYRPDRYAFEIDLVRSGAADTKAWSPVVRRPPSASRQSIECETLDSRTQTGRSQAATLKQEGE